MVTLSQFQTRTETLAINWSHFLRPHSYSVKNHERSTGAITSENEAASLSLAISVPAAAVSLFLKWYVSFSIYILILAIKMFQSQSKDAYDLLPYCNVSHIKLSSNVIHYILKTKYSFIYYSIGYNRNNWILDMNSMRNMNMEIPHLHSLHLALLTDRDLLLRCLLSALHSKTSYDHQRTAVPFSNSKREKKSIKWSVRNQLCIDNATE